MDIKLVYCDDEPSEYIDDVTMNDIYDIIESTPNICKIVDVSGSKKKVVWTDEYGFERAYESKKSVRKSMKESKDTDFFNAMAKKFNFTKDELKKYKDKTYISVIGILFDRIRSVPTYSDEWYNAMNDCWEGIQTAEDNGFNVDYEKKVYDKIMMTPNYNRESKKSVRKSIKESVKLEIQLMVNNIIDELIGEYSSKEWDSLSVNEKFDIVRTEYFSFGYKSKYLSEVRDLVIENMNHPFNVVFESKKSMKESFDDGDQLVIDVVDMLILDFGYDKKTVEKYFYKIHKLNDFDTISIDEYIKIKEEIEKVLGYDDIF